MRKQDGAFTAFSALTVTLPWLVVLALQLLLSAGAGWAAALERRWAVDFHGSNSAPVLAEGIIYLGSTDGGVYAFDVVSGDLRWRFQTGEGLTSGPEIIEVGPGEEWSAVSEAMGKKAQGKKEVSATPIVDHGTVYVGSEDWSFYALDASTGKKRWSFETQGRIVSEAAVVGEIVCFASVDGYLYGLDKRTGALRWSLDSMPGRLERERRAPVRPLIDDRTVYHLALSPLPEFGEWETSTLHALDAETGKTKWTMSVEGNGLGGLADGGDLIVFAIYSQVEPTSVLYAVTKDSGELKWTFKAAGRVGRGRGAERAGDVILLATDEHLFALDLASGLELRSLAKDFKYERILTDRGSLYYTRSTKSGFRQKSRVHALEAKSGRERWTIGLGSNSFLPTIGGGILYATSRAGLYSSGYLLRAIDTRNGQELWRANLRKQASADPLISDRVICVPAATSGLWGQKTEIGRLDCFDAPP